MKERITLNVNNESYDVEVEPDMPLLYALRNDLELTGAKFGCGLAQCGACTVIMEGRAIRSCMTPVRSVQGRQIRTIEGLGTAEKPHPVQQAFIEEQVPQCGLCLSGWLMTSVALLEANPRRSDDEIRRGLAGLKCRCGTHMSILRAVNKAAKAMA
ncbi:MAG: (2Fe-2S)-binding protein [Acidobacteria bacterium]|nr:(2Fe-2S)-binding protein [Acidobacteriota bacterium]MCZ6769732.1 (2Fe-2S)-binding protein [Acidobacteriota bacterium]MCZ6876552.1 (2Fe-2S)-binding protein [Acidobacteriota bacterium]